MAQKSMADYVWLADTLAGYTAQAKQYGIPEYGLKLSTIKELYKQRDNLYRTGSAKEMFNDNSFAYWRVRLWFYFGLIVEYVHAKGYEHRYRLINPELLIESKTLRELMLSLVKDDEPGSPDVTISALNTYIPSRWRKEHSTGDESKSTGAVSTDTTGMHCMVADNASHKYNYDYASRIDAHFLTEEDEERLSMVEFSMMMGESLVLRIFRNRKYKSIGERTMEDMEQCKYVFQPQAIKEIDYRWYVLGTGYFADAPNKQNIAVFDVKDLVLYDDGSEPILYELKKDFKIENYIPEWNASWESKLLDFQVKQTGKHYQSMLCPLVPASSQNKVINEHYTPEAEFVIYTKPSKDLLIKYMAYCDVISVDLPKPTTRERNFGKSHKAFVEYLKKLADYWDWEIK